jgi:hypothetical protein
MKAFKNIHSTTFVTCINAYAHGELLVRALHQLTVGVLPGLGKAAVVPEDGAVVVAKIALLDVLGDGVVGFLCGDLHLGLGHLGNLNDHVVPAVPLEGDVVPGADGGTILALEVEAEGLGGGLSGLLGGDRVEGGGQGAGGEAADGGGEGRGSGGGGGDGEEGGDGGELHGGTVQIGGSNTNKKVSSSKRPASSRARRQRLKCVTFAPSPPAPPILTRPLFAFVLYYLASS